MKKTIIIELIITLYSILFLYTGISKLLEFDVFKEQIEVSPILSPLAGWIAWILPLAEITVVILLFIPNFRVKGLYAALGLMLLFTGYIIWVLLFSKRLLCSCGGIIEMLSWKQHLVFNIFFIGLALVGIVIKKKSSPKTPSGEYFNTAKNKTLYKNA